MVGLKVSDIQRSLEHIHNRGLWLGSRAGWDGTDEDEAASNDRITDFQLDAGNDIWGESKCILGALDTPIQSGKKRFGFNRIVVSAVEASVRYRIRFAWGESYAAAIAAGTFTEMEFFAIDKKGGSGPIEFFNESLPAGTKVFAAVWAEGENTSTIDFTFGIHEYDI